MRRYCSLAALARISEAAQGRIHFFADAFA
jgi:hypothetical protein